MSADFQNSFTVRVSTKFVKQCHYTFHYTFHHTLHVWLHYHVKYCCKQIREVWPKLCWLTEPQPWPAEIWRTGWGCDGCTEEPTEWQIVRSHCRQEERCCSETSASHAIDVQPVADGACQSVCQNWAALVWYSSSLESRWTEPTTVTFFCCDNMLLDICHIAGEFFIFQQDSALAHWAHEIILNARLLPSSRRICGRWTAQASIQLTTKFGAWCSNESTRRKCRMMWTIWDSVWLTCGREWYKALLTTPLTSGADVCVHVFRRGHWIFTVTC